MTDALALKNLVNEFPYSAGYKNKDSVFIHANVNYARVVGLKYAEEVTSRTAYDMPAKTSECATLFHEQDNRVMATGKYLIIFGIHPDEQGVFKAYRFIKIPLRNEHNEIAGTFFTGEEITNITTYELSAFIKKIPVKINGKLLSENGSYLVGTEHSEIQMSERHHEVLFYMLHGKQTSFIAEVLGITSKTVDKHIDQLRKKFNVTSSFELIDKALDTGFSHVLPTSVFNKQIVTVLNQK